MSPRHLPGASGAVVEQRKILEYLLNLEHKDGRGKARFLMSFGFTVEQWEVLRDALLRHGGQHAVSTSSETAYGVNYSVDCTIDTPDRRNPCIRTVWEVKGKAAPRLITAYPK